MRYDDKLIYLLSTAQHTLRQYLINVFAREGLGITPPQATVLFLLRHKDGRSLSECSKTLGVDNSAMTGLVDRLEKAGLVERKMNKNDRRAFILHLTHLGSQEAKRAEVIVKKINKRIEDGFERPDMESFRRVLVGICRMFSA